MKAQHVTEGLTLPIKRGSVVIIFDPKEQDLACYMCEYAAAMLELNGYNMNELWKFAQDVRNVEQH